MTHWRFGLPSLHVSCPPAADATNISQRSWIPAKRSRPKNLGSARRPAATFLLSGAHEIVETTLMPRCSWATLEPAITYHDQEWGVPLKDERRLFEFLILEGAQAGLNWITI